MKRNMADVMSVLAMTMAPPGSRECLKFKLQGSNTNISSWGHEYVRSLSGEISEEYNQRSLDAPAEDDVDVDDLLTLVEDMVPFQMQHNAEAEAVDLLMEVQQLKRLVETPIVDARNYERVCLYLLRCADFTSEPDDLYNIFNTAYLIYKAQGKYVEALRVLLKMDDNDHDRINELFAEETGANALSKLQMSFLLGRHKSSFCQEDDNLNQIIGNASLSERFMAIARDMDVQEPKSPEEIYKSASDNRSLRNPTHVPAESAKANLASSIVNAFVNAGHCKDKLMLTEGESSAWVFKNKDHGQMTAVASVGMLNLWNNDDCLSHVDKYMLSNDENIKAGACFAIGICSSGVRNDADTSLALLGDTDQLENRSKTVRIASICGLGVAYAGAQKIEVSELLQPIISNTDGADIAEVSLAALALGMVFVGTCSDDVGSVLVQRLMESSTEDLDNSMSRFLCLGLGLLYLGKQDRAEGMLEAVRTVEHKRGKYAENTLLTCAYAGTGNVLKVQSMLHVCAEHLTENADHQAVAVLGIALISVGEDIGTEMTLRTFEHLLHYGELPVKRVVPLALALLYISNPDYAIIDQLSRLSHDQDIELSQGAVLGLGLVSAGTNNSRVAGLLRQLSEFYAKDANTLFVVRLAQGLNCMGKGLLTLNPFHSDRLLMSGSSVAGILTIMHACMDMKATILDKYHYILYFLAPSINPRYMSTVDTDLKPISVSVRVGQAVETVGQAGRPKTITGFQTHTTPVLLNYRDRSELANKEFVSVTSILEGVVILEKAPEEDGAMET